MVGHLYISCKPLILVKYTLYSKYVDVVTLQDHSQCASRPGRLGAGSYTSLSTPNKYIFPKKNLVTLPAKSVTSEDAAAAEFAVPVVVEVVVLII